MLSGYNDLQIKFLIFIGIVFVTSLLFAGLIIYRVEVVTKKALAAKQAQKEAQQKEDEEEL